MDRCHLCKRKAVLELPYLKKWVCQNCLLKMNYKRFRNQTRGVIKPHLLCNNSSSFHLMKYFFDRTGMKYKISPKGKIKSTTQDEIVDNFLLSVINNKPIKKIKEVLPMSLIPQREIDIMNKNLGLPTKREKESSISKSLEEVEKRRPGVKFSIRKIIKELQEL